MTDSRAHKSNASQTQRRPYEKPALRKFSLKVEEVLVDNCKTAGGGDAVPFAAPGCAIGGCSTVGS